MSDEDAGDEDPAQRGRGQHRGPPVQVDHRHRGHGAERAPVPSPRSPCATHAVTHRPNPAQQLATGIGNIDAVSRGSLLATAKVVKLVCDRALVGCWRVGE